MNRRLTLAAATVFFSILGGFSSFYFARSQAQFASLNFVFFALATVIALVGVLLDKREEPSGLSGLSIAGLVFLAWALFSSVVSGRFASTILGMSTSLIGLGALVCFGSLALFAQHYRDEVMTVLGYSAPAVALLVGLYGIIAQPVTSPDGTVLDALHLGFANSSELALFYVLLTPFVLMRGYAYLKNEQVCRVGRYLIVSVLFAATLINAMRMASVMIAVIALYYVATELMVKRSMRRIVVGGALGVGAVGAVVLLASALAGKVGASFLSIRGQLWRMASAEIAQRPLLGYGADGFFGASARIAKPGNWWGGQPLHLTDGTTDPHNMLLLMTVSFGIIGLMLLLVMFGLWVVRALATQTAHEEEYAEKGSTPKSKIAKKQQDTGVSRGYFSAPLVGALAGVAMLMTMPTTVNLLPLLALCFGSAVAHPDKKFDRGVSFGHMLTLVGVVGALIFTLFTGVDALARFSLGGVTYLAGPSFEKAWSVNKVFGFDPFIAHELNTAFVYSPSTGSQAASELARMVAYHTERATQADKTNPYYRLMYLNVLYKSGQVSSPLWQKTEKSPDDLRLALLKIASQDFPRQPDIDIELAYSAAHAGEKALAREALKTVTDLGEYGKQIWSEPLANIEATLGK